LVLAQQWAQECRLELQRVEWRRWEVEEPLWALRWARVLRWVLALVGLRRWEVVLLLAVPLPVQEWLLVLAVRLLLSVVLLALLVEEPYPSGVNSLELVVGDKVGISNNPKDPICLWRIRILLCFWVHLDHNRHRI